MLKNLIKKGKGNKGFTLIELIVVIAIIAILALILVPRFTGFTETANNRTNESNRRTIETAVNVMMADGRLGGTGSFTVSAGVTVGAPGAGLTWTPTPVAPATVQTEIQAALRTLVGDKMTPAGGVTSYTVTITAGNVTVTNT